MKRTTSSGGTSQSPDLAVSLLDGAWVFATFMAVVFAVQLAVVDELLTPITMLVFFFALGLPLAAAIAPAGSRLDGVRIFLLAFCFNAVAAIVLYQLLEERYGVPYLLGGTDDQLFDTLGRELAGQGILGLREGGHAVSGVAKYAGYPITVAWTYSIATVLGGAHSIAPRYLNVLAGGILAVLVFRLAIHLRYGHAVAKLSAYLVGIYPFLVFHNSLILRDTLTAVFLVGATLCFLEIWQDRNRWPQVAVLLLTVALLTTYRDSSAFLLVVSFGIAYLASPQGYGRRWLRVLALVGLFFIALAGARILFEWAQYALRYQDLYAQLSASRAGADSIAMQLLRLPFPLDIAIRLPLGLMWPLPLPARDPAQLLLNSGAVLWYPLLPFVLLGWLDAFRSSARRPTAIIAFMFFLGVVLVTLAYRHMTQYVPFLLPFGVGAYYELPDARLPVLILASLAAATAIGLYLFFKMIS